MAFAEFIGTNGDLNTAGNWSTGSVPSSGTIGFMSGTTNINGSLSTFNLVNDLTVVVGENFAGKIGSSGSPIQFGTGTTVNFYGANCKVSHWDVQTATQIVINATRGMGGSFVFEQGTATEFVAQNGSDIYIGANATCTMLRGAGAGASVVAEAGATLTDTHWHGGKLISYTDMPDALITNGIVEWLGDSNNGDASGTIEVAGPGAVFRWWTEGGVLATLKVYDGLADASGSQYERTVTNSEVHGGRLNLDNGVDTIIATNDPKWYGGQLNAGPSVAIASQFSTPTPRLGLP